MRSPRKIHHGMTRLPRVPLDWFEPVKDAEIIKPKGGGMHKGNAVSGHQMQMMVLLPRRSAIATLSNHEKARWQKFYLDRAAARIKARNQRRALRAHAA